MKSQIEMQLNVKFLQILSIIYISFESINSEDSNKIIPKFFMPKIHFLKIDILHSPEYVFASAAINNKHKDKNRRAKCGRKII